MKLLLFISMGLISLASIASDFDKVPLSTSFYEASANCSKRSDFHEFLESSTIKSATYKAYLGAAKALMAEVVSNPYTKLTLFNDGKQLIDQAVKSDPKNPELRYVRFMIQLNTPDYLNYNDNMDSDFVMIKCEILDSDYKESWMQELSQYLLSIKSNYKI